MKNAAIIALLLLTSFLSAHASFAPTYDLVIRTDNMTNSTIACIYSCLKPAESIYNSEYFIKLVLVVILVGLSALSAGMILGLMGLDPMTLEIISQSGTLTERKYASALIPLRKRGNHLLVTLIITNIFINSAISIVVEDIAPGLLGFVISTCLITVFGEIIPQSVCSRNAMLIGANVRLIVYLFIILIFPIAYPISLILDWILGEDMGTIFSNRELQKLIEFHNETNHADLEDVEAKILTGALDFAKKTVKQVMTPIEKVFMLEESLKLNRETVTQIWQSGNSRVPVYRGHRNSIVGVIHAKDLILVDPEDDLPLSTIMTFYGREFIPVDPDDTLGEVLKTFQTGKSHLAMVRAVVTVDGRDPTYVTIGLVTLEDVIEEILRDEIHDETELRVTESMFKTGKQKTQRLTPQKVIAVGSFLTKTFSCFHYLPDEKLFKLLGMSHVENYTPDDKEQPFLYKRGKEYDYFSLILSGHCEIVTGNDEFVVETSSWTPIGVRTLYIPLYHADFSARVTTPAKILKIQKGDFQRIVGEVYQTNKEIPSEIRWCVN